jgi:hypothetical protein
MVETFKAGITSMVAMNRTIYSEIGRRMRELPLEKPVSSYEWEELVQKMCASGDAGLRDIGAKELYDLLHRRPVNGGK